MEKNETSESEENFFDKILDDSESQEDKKNIIIQYRIINNHGIMAGDGTQFENIQINDNKNQNIISNRQNKSDNNKKNVFSTENNLSSWLFNNYETYPMALMIASAVFDGFPYIWVIQAADILYSSFQREGTENERRYGITDLLKEE